MIATARQLRSRFTDVELARMFNVELGTLKDGRKADACECSIPLWTISRRQGTAVRANSVRISGADKIRAGITDAEAGTADRVAALAAFYANAGDAEVSAFED